MPKQGRLVQLKIAQLRERKALPQTFFPEPARAFFTHLWGQEDSHKSWKTIHDVHEHQFETFILSSFQAFGGGFAFNKIINITKTDENRSGDKSGTRF